MNSSQPQLRGRTSSHSQQYPFNVSSNSQQASLPSHSQQQAQILPSFHSQHQHSSEDYSHPQQHHSLPPSVSHQTSRPNTIEVGNTRKPMQSLRKRGTVQNPGFHPPTNSDRVGVLWCLHRCMAAHKP